MNSLILLLFAVVGAVTTTLTSQVLQTSVVSDAERKRNLFSSYQIGEFLVEINLQDIQLTVTKTTSPTRNLFQTSSQLFIQIGEANVTQPPIVNGNYQVHETILWRTTSQSIDDIQMIQREIEKIEEAEGEKLGQEQTQQEELIITGELWTDDRSYSTNYFLSFHLSPLSSNQLSFTLNTSGASNPSALSPPSQANRLFLSSLTSADESFHGFGESFTSFNLKGKRIPILVSEQGVGRDLQPITNDLNNATEGTGGHWYTTYAPKPLYLTNLNRSLFYENSEVLVGDNSVNTLTRMYVDDVH
jgi:hypothetical protein